MPFTVADLCEHGFLPREVPPAFKSSSLAIASSIPPRTGRVWTEGTRFNLARSGGLRRSLSIPNPESYVALAQAIVTNWPLLDAVYQRSPITASTPEPRIAASDRSYHPKLWFSNRPGERARCRAGARFLLIGDLSQCYSSIYTHSFSWALAGKSAAKAAVLSHTSVSGTDLDKASCNLNLGQTKGIPIGPDTSHILAELILTSIDLEMSSRLSRFVHNGKLPALRITDDFEYFAATRSEAEEVLLAWETAATQYELQVNPAKTVITELPVALQDHWAIELTQFRFRRVPAVALGNDLYSFFSIAYELAERNRTAAIMAYAIRRVQAIRVLYMSDSLWQITSELMLASIVIEPAALRFVVPAFERAIAAGRTLNTDAIAVTLNEIVSYHAPLAHGCEVAWALYLMIRLATPLLYANAKRVAEMDDNVSILLLRCLESHSLVDGGLVDWTPSVTRAEAPDALSSTDWLLAFEFGSRGWSSPTNIAGHPWFDQAAAAGLSFFDCPVPEPSRVAAADAEPDEVSDSEEWEDVLVPDLGIRSFAP